MNTFAKEPFCTLEKLEWDLAQTGQKIIITWMGKGDNWLDLEVEKHGKDD